MVNSGAQFFFPPGTMIAGNSYLVVNFGAAGAPGFSAAAPLAESAGGIYLLPPTGPFVQQSPVRYGPPA